MSDYILDDENEKIQRHYQVLLSLKWFQVTALEERKSTQQSTSDKYDFYEQVKKTNQIDRKLK